MKPRSVTFILLVEVSIRSGGDIMAAPASSTSTSRKAEGPYGPTGRNQKAASEVIAALMEDSQIQQFDEERTQHIYDESSRQKGGIVESPEKRAKVQIQGFDEIKELMIAQSKMIEVVARAASQAAEAAATAATVIAQAQARANLQSQVPGRQELEVAITANVMQNVAAATAAQVAMLTTTRNEEAQEVHDEQGMSDYKKIEELRKYQIT